MLMLMRKSEQHKTNEWVRFSYVSAYAYACVAGVLTCLCLCYAYALVRTLKGKDTPPGSTLLASCAMVESQNNGRIT